MRETFKRNKQSKPRISNIQPSLLQRRRASADGIQRVHLDVSLALCAFTESILIVRSRAASERKCQFELLNLGEPQDLRSSDFDLLVSDDGRRRRKDGGVRRRVGGRGRVTRRARVMSFGRVDDDLSKRKGELARWLSRGSSS